MADTFREIEERQRQERIQRGVQRQITDLASREAGREVRRTAPEEFPLFQRERQRGERLRGQAEKEVGRGEREVLGGVAEQERNEAFNILKQLAPVLGNMGSPVEVFSQLDQATQGGDIVTAVQLTDRIIASASGQGQLLTPQEAARLKDLPEEEQRAAAQRITAERNATTRRLAGRLAEIVTSSMASGLGRPPQPGGGAGGGAMGGIPPGSTFITPGGISGPGGTAGPVERLTPGEAGRRGLEVDPELRARAEAGQQVFVGRGSDVARVIPERPSFGTELETARAGLVSRAPGIPESRPGLLPIGGTPAGALASMVPAVGEIGAAATAVPRAIGRGLDIGGEAITGVARPAVEGLMERAGAVGEGLGNIVEQAQGLARSLLSQGFNVGEVVDFLRQRFPSLGGEGEAAAAPTAPAATIPAPSAPVTGRPAEFAPSPKLLPGRARTTQFLTRRGRERENRRSFLPLR